MSFWSFECWRKKQSTWGRFRVCWQSGFRSILIGHLISTFCLIWQWNGFDFSSSIHFQNLLSTSFPDHFILAYIDLQKLVDVTNLCNFIWITCHIGRNFKNLQLKSSRHVMLKLKHWHSHKRYNFGWQKFFSLKCQ